MIYLASNDSFARFKPYTVNAAFSNLSQELTVEALDEIYDLTIEELDTAVKEWLREQYP
jgi:hypothetical protein